MATADTIFVNGDIVTMNDAAPSAGALAVKDGRVLAIGSEAEVMATRGPSTAMIDLAGRALLPGFLDGHSHFINAVRMVTWANVSSPPVGPVRNIPDLIAVLKEVKARQG